MLMIGEKMELCEIKNSPWLLSREAFEIYRSCMYRASFSDYLEEMGKQAADGCRIFVCRADGAYQGIIVLDAAARTRAEITGIAVRQESRGRGVGKFMVFSAADALKIRRVFAETDDDAVEFYRRLGFSVQPFVRHFSDGDVTRYRCELTI